MILFVSTHTEKDTYYSTSTSSTRNIHPHLYRITIANAEHATCSTRSHRVRFFSDMGPNRYNTTLISVWLIRLKYGLFSSDEITLGCSSPVSGLILCLTTR